MAIIDKIKSDIKFRNKVIAGAVIFAFVMVIGVVSVLAMNSDQEDNLQDGSKDIEKEMAIGVVPTDTTRVVSEKNVLYNEMDYFQSEEDKDIVVVADENKIGKTKEEIAQLEKQEDDEIASYMRRRRESINNTSSQSAAPSYETPSYGAASSGGATRRKYNPYASSDDWTTTSGLSDGLDNYKTGREKQKEQEQGQVQSQHQVQQRPSIRKEKATSFEELPKSEQRRILLEIGQPNYQETSEFSAMIITKEDAYINFEKVPKGTTIAGTTSFNENRLQVNFSTIRLKKKIIKVDLTLYSLDGLQGLPVGSDLTNKSISDTGFDEATSENISGTRLERIGKSLLKSGKQRREVKVDLGRDIMCILVNNNVK